MNEHSRSFLLLLAIVVIFGSIVVSCAVRRGAVHTVKEGETLWQISRAYEVDLDILLRVNGIQNARDVQPGTRITIPGAAKRRELASKRDQSTGRQTGASSSSVKTSSGSGEGSTSSSSPIKPSIVKGSTNSDEIRSIKKTFQPVWPCQGRLASRFEKGGGPTKRGIRIHVPSGTVVRAAEDGIVKLAGQVEKLSKLGNIVIIYHRNDIATVYAHLNDVQVDKSEKVEKGDALGTVGSSGSVDQASCYFEVRYKLEPRDPLIFLGEPA